MGASRDSLNGRPETTRRAQARTLERWSAAGPRRGAPEWSEARAQEYLGNAIKLNPSLQRFAERLKDAYNYFEEKKQLPVITVTPKGEYIIN